MAYLVFNYHYHSSFLLAGLKMVLKEMDERHNDYSESGVCLFGLAESAAQGCFIRALY